MSVYKKLIESVENGNRFKIDLVNKNLWINKRQIIMEGSVVYEKYLNEPLIESDDLADYFEYNPILNEHCWGVANYLYSNYKHSSPKQTTLGNKPYFKALDIEDLYDYDLAYGLDRNIAQFILESYILFASLNEWLKLENEKHWFYQSQDDRQFVVLKEWI